MSHRTIARAIAVAVACALALAPSAAFGVRPAKDDVALPKPAAIAHPDVAPIVPGNGLAEPAPTADRGRKAGGATACGSIMPVSGTNLVSFGSFVDGDIIVVTDPTSFTGHAGMFDKRYYGTINSLCVWSANTSPINGVQREPGIKYRANEVAWGVRVSGGAAYGAAARSWAASQAGHPYNILGTKTDLQSFYCSKLVWCAWRYTYGVDLDADGGYWVWPIDLVNSPRTYVFGYWS